ncbi:rolling circle replication-associated protein [Calycomorphotria hydatis]|uniref:Replication-associated protein ORF2/G2P domain-containing protein n=1 Tax=Calycomorphotria hydatis TaxID=2528027 RepID=A0A517TBR8_9PLAN|nr:hypothetical protein [Calycomorphotria hydatis]QDT65814.1 hypothetical protein V22_30760 [Calycomorphotria hydatis]
MCESMSSPMGKECPKDSGTDAATGAGESPPLLLENNYEIVTDVEQESVYELRPCRCNSWFCDDCAPLRGIELKARLDRCLSQWSSVLMLTLTLDPEIFNNDPVKAWEYVKREKCLSLFHRKLRRAGLVAEDSHWFCVVEFQKSGMPHFHMLVESKFIDQARAAKLWGSFRPKWAGPNKRGDRCALGYVSCNGGGKFKSAKHACNYVTKYITKRPRDGWPEWVRQQESGRQVRRYTASRGFWHQDPQHEEQEPAGEISPCRFDCYCEKCSGAETENSATESEQQPEEEEPSRPQKLRYENIGERVADCGTDAAIVRRDQGIGKGKKPSFKFIAKAGRMDEAIYYLRQLQGETRSLKGFWKIDEHNIKKLARWDHGQQEVTPRAVSYKQPPEPEQGDLFKEKTAEAWIHRAVTLKVNALLE